MNDFSDIDRDVESLVLPIGRLWCELCHYRDDTAKVRATHWGSRGWNLKRPWPLCEDCYGLWLRMSPRPGCMDQDTLKYNWINYTTDYPDHRYTTGVNLDR